MNESSGELSDVSDQAWISRNKLKSKLRLKSEILLKFEKSQKKTLGRQKCVKYIGNY